MAVFNLCGSPPGVVVGGTDRINSEGGNDQLWDDAWACAFVCELGSDANLIADFMPGADKIELSKIRRASFAQL